MISTGRPSLSAACAVVTTGTPTVEGTRWPAYDLGTRPTLIFDDAPHVEHDPRGDEREAWGSASWSPGTWYPVPD